MGWMRIKHNETGRSMLEMIGVLAIIGVLSAGGIAGYRYGMDKYHAATTINEINRRSLVYSQQMMLKNKELSGSEFKNTTDLGYPISVNKIENQPYFRIELDNVPKGVCKNIVSADWLLPFALYVNGRPDSGKGVDCPIKENKMAFYFYGDLKEDPWDLSSDSSDSSDYSDYSDSSDSSDSSDNSDWYPEETWIFICQSNNECGRSAPVCDTDTGECGPCSTNDDCTRYASYPICNTETGACEKCTTNDDCASFVGRPVCLASKGYCVECSSNDHCTEEAPYCDASTNTCSAVAGKPCASNTDCNDGSETGDYYCRITPGCNQTSGKCERVVLQNGVINSVRGKKLYWSKNSIGWRAANNFCAALGLQLFGKDLSVYCTPEEIAGLADGSGKCAGLDLTNSWDWPGWTGTAGTWELWGQQMGPESGCTGFSVQFQNGALINYFKINSSDSEHALCEE